MEIGDLAFKAQAGEVIAEAEDTISNRTNAGRMVSSWSLGQDSKLKPLIASKLEGRWTYCSSGQSTIAPSMMDKRPSGKVGSCK